MNTESKFIVFRYPWVEKGGFESWVLMQVTSSYQIVKYFERMYDIYEDNKWFMSKTRNATQIMSQGYLFEGIFTLEELKSSRYQNFVKNMK